MTQRLRCLALLLALVVAQSFAGTTSVHSNLLFQHSFFANKHWLRSSDTITYNLASSYTALTPVKSCVAGNDSDNIILFSATDKKLYLMHAILNSPPTVSSYPTIKAMAPVVSPAGNADSVFGLFASTSQNLTIVFLTTAGSSNKIVVYRMIGQGFSIFQTDTLTVALPSGAKITGLYGGPALAKGTQSCIWAVGSKGLIRYFGWNGSLWSVETVYDIKNTETVTSLCLAAVGTQSGTIYGANGGTFDSTCHPVNTAISMISTQGAVSAAGKVIKNTAGLWKLFTAGSANYSYCNFIPLTNGAGVELLDENWNYFKYQLEENPTNFTVLPSKIAYFINNGYYNYMTSAPETCTVILRDPDLNFMVPSLKINTTTNLAFNSTDTLYDMHPDTAIAVKGYTELADTTIKIIYSQSSVRVIAKVRTSAFNSLSYKYYWVNTTFQSDNVWHDGDMINIVLGSQSLKIMNHQQSTVVDGFSNSGDAQSFSALRKANGLQCFFARNDIRAVYVYTAAGKEVARVFPAHKTHSMNIQLDACSGILLFEIHFIDGSFIHKVLPLVK